MITLLYGDTSLHVPHYVIVYFPPNDGHVIRFLNLGT